MPYNISNKFVKSYILNIDKYDGSSKNNLRSLFETNEEFISYCFQNYDATKRGKNIIWDLQKNGKKNNSSFLL